MLPKISIITPSFNQSRFIEQTIRSVLDQNYPDIEYIVVDGGSTDGTLDILKHYEDHLIWISEPDNGQASAINKGFRMATGEILAFVNSDDLYLPNALQQVANYFIAHPEAIWVTGKCITIDANKRETRKLITAYKYFWLWFRSYSVLQVLNYISQPATFWRRTVFDKLGPLDERLYYTMDYEYWLRIGNHHRLHYLPSNLAVFRLHASSKSGLTAHKQFDEQYLVAKTYHAPAGLLLIHQLHNWITTTIYTKEVKS